MSHRATPQRLVILPPRGRNCFSPSLTSLNQAEASPLSSSRAWLQPRYNPLRRIAASAAKILTLSFAIVFFAAIPAILRAQQSAQPTHQHTMQMAMPTATSTDPTGNLPSLTPPTNLLSEADTRPPLTLESLLNQALTTSPILAQTRAQTTRLQSLARQSSLYPNPTIGYQGDQIRGGSVGGGEQGAFLAQTIPLGGKLTLRRKALEAEAQTNAATTQTTQTALRNDLTQAFYAALAAQQSAHIRRQLLAVAQDATQTVHQLANVGQADLPDVLATEVEQEQATIADLAAQRFYLARFHVLAALANQPSLLPAPLTGDLTQTTIVPTIDQILQTSPQLTEARTQIIAAEARLTSAHREVVPDLQLKAGEQYDFEQLGTYPNHQTGPQSFASAAITLPLWNRNQGNIAAAEADLESARQNLRRLQLALQQQAQPLLETYAATLQQATLYRSSILPRAKKATELYEQKYNQMAQAYPQVLVSRRTLLNLQLRYTETLATLWRTAATLQNGVFTDNLGRTINSLPSMPMSNPNID